MAVDGRTAAASGERDRIRLEIGGMTCASCAARIERRLNRLPSVEASVNLTTEEAAVTFDPSAVAPDELVATVEAAGYSARLPDEAGDRADADEGRGPLLRLILAAALTVPVVIVAMLPQARFPGWQWMSLALSAPVVLWAGWSFHRTALVTARHGAATMDTLISLGTLVALSWSTATLVTGSGTHTYFEVAAVITTLILLGRYLEARARRRSGAAVRALLELGARSARIVRDGREVEVPISQVAVGDRFVVRPGERIATDGVVEEGSSAIDRSMLTGEPIPEEVGPGDEVAGATINTYGRLVVRATRVGADTALARIARLVREAQQGKAGLQRLADRVAGVFVPAVIAVAVATLVGWLVVTGEAGRAVTAAVAVLIVACPCALGLATPTALAVGTGRGARLGILIRGPEVLESTRRVTTVVLDKTGTVTEGSPAVTAIEIASGWSRAEVLRLAGAVEAASEHPVARAIATAARSEVGSLPPVTSFRNRPGTGVEGVVEGRAVTVERAVGGGIAVQIDGREAARVTVADRVKAGSREAVAGLKALGLTPVLLTGDAPDAAERVAREVGIDRVAAGVLPDGKADVIADLQRAGEVVAMVGDGINDAPALARADLGMAIGTGTDIAIESADITLVSGDLRAATDALRLARATVATIKGNLFWAFAYNVAAIPLAVAGLLNPMIAAAAMACSSLFVVSNSLRLRRFSSERQGEAP